MLFCVTNSKICVKFGKDRFICYTEVTIGPRLAMGMGGGEGGGNVISLQDLVSLT